jgi:plasmid stabilization system protein ParE
VKVLRVEYLDDARDDLRAIYDWLSNEADPETALAYVQRIDEFCRGLGRAPARGSRRDNIRPGLCVVGFERRVTVAFVVEAEQVDILRLFYGGQNWSEKL